MPRPCRAPASPPPRPAASPSPPRASPSPGGPTAARSGGGRPPRAAPDRLGQRALAGALPAAVRRLGAYDRDALDRAAHYAPRRLFEYWGHEASLMPVELQPLLRWRMARAHTRRGAACGASRASGPSSSSEVLEEVRARGPARRPRARRGAARGAGPWWDWSDVQAGDRVAVLERRGHLGAAAQLRAHVRPARAGAPDGGARRADADARRRRSASCCGSPRARWAWPPSRSCATTSGCRSPASAPRVAELVEAGELLPVEVEGWDRPAYLHRDARIPRRVDARALVGPFDTLMWERSRVERLFGFRYRIEIYVPEPKRVYGYYVLPFLLGDRLVARVDLKADRQEGLLRVQAAHVEPRRRPRRPSELREELELLAGWLGLGGVYLS